MFRTQYVPPVERDRLAQEYFSLKQTTYLVTNIIKMFIGRALFCPQYASLKYVQVTCYLSMLNNKIREFMANAQYRTLAELQSNTRRRNIEIDNQKKEKKQVTYQDRSQSATKWFESTDSMSGVVEQRGPRCGKRGKFHAEVCQLFACNKCGKEGHFGKEFKQSTRVCFHSNQEGHIMASYPLFTVGIVQNPAHLAWKRSD